MPGEPVQDKLRDRLRLLALQEVAAAGHEFEPVRAGEVPGLALHHLGPLVIDAGADPNALTTSRGSQPGPGDETPLHYAASSDDADVAEALIDGGADIETPDGSIGTPLDNAVGYGCWHVARLLVTRGARVDKAWHAAALGMLGRIEALLGSDPPAQDVSQAFWHACTGGQRRAAEYLLSRGADLNWEPDYAHGTPLDAASGPGTRQENVISWLRELGARSASSD